MNGRGSIVPKAQPCYKVKVIVVKLDETGQSESNSVEVKENDAPSALRRITAIVGALLPEIDNNKEN